MAETGWRSADEEIEITPEMIEAGIKAYVDFFVPIVEGHEGAASSMVIAVFAAMCGAFSSAVNPVRSPLVKTM